MNAKRLIVFLVFGFALQCVAARAVMSVPEPLKPGVDNKEKAQFDYERALLARKSASREPAQSAQTPNDAHAAELLALREAPRVDDALPQKAAGLAALAPEEVVEHRVDWPVLIFGGLIALSLFGILAFMLYSSRKYKQRMAAKPSPGPDEPKRFDPRAPAINSAGGNKSA